jgi:type IV pilus assembly protein PilW
MTKIPLFLTPVLYRHQQSGFTLVEIMIAISLSLLMLAGIMQISLANKESSRLQRNMSFIQENTRTAMAILSEDIRMAGFYTDDNPDARILTEPAPFNNVVASTTDTTVAVTADGGGADNDQLTLSYESDSDCLGQGTPEATNAPISGNRFAVNHYFIRNQRLMCLGNGNAAPQPLVEGVESLQILYGENTDGNPQSANRYVQAQQVGDMQNVVSVRIGMRLISREAVRSNISNDQYALLDAAAFAPSDRLLRKEITSTIFLRNTR